VENTSKSFGGKLSFMHDSLFKESHGYLGSYPKKLHPGDVQHMVFHENDPGPFEHHDTTM
jgi:hypothetical protein